MTHVGHYRQVNEDSGEVIKRGDDALMAIVADGMGGHQAGDVASQMAVDHLRKAFDEVDLDKSNQDWEDWLLHQIRGANQSIFDYAQQHESHYGMGTTLAVTLCFKEYYIVAHVGDSRVYRYHDQQLEKVTEDHSLVNELVRTGQISEEQAEIHPQRNVITRALGTDEDVKADIRTLFYLDHEHILLCSDGLTNMIEEEQMKDILDQYPTADEKAAVLLQYALDAGGDDNITLILLHKIDEDGRK
nr:Stp1/IreP family PP2C-type Ser/Thr phosphatase [Caldalkalibacillus salinus]